MVKQYELYRNHFPSTRRFAPLVVVLSSHLLDVDTAVVAPLVTDAAREISEIDVTVEHDGATYIVAIHDLAAVDRSLLRSRAGEISVYADALERSINRLFNGF